MHDIQSLTKCLSRSFDDNKKEQWKGFAFNNSKMILFWDIFLMPYSFCGGGKEKGLLVLLIKMKILIN